MYQTFLAHHQSPTGALTACSSADVVVEQPVCWHLQLGLLSGKTQVRACSDPQVTKTMTPGTLSRQNKVRSKSQFEERLYGKPVVYLFNLLDIKHYLYSALVGPFFPPYLSDNLVQHCIKKLLFRIFSAGMADNYNFCSNSCA